MASQYEIAEQVARFLGGSLSLDDFEDWSAEYSWNIHNKADRPTVDLAYLVESLLVEHASEALHEPDLRKELAKAIRPFAKMAEVVAVSSASNPEESPWILPGARRKQVRSTVDSRIEHERRRYA